MFRRLESDIGYFTVISYWTSIEAIKAFSGEDITKTRHADRDREMLLELPERVELRELCYGTAGARLEPC